MLPRVHTVHEAMEWFLENGSGSVVCVKENGTMKEVSSYVDAMTFFGTE